MFIKSNNGTPMKKIGFFVLCRQVYMAINAPGAPRKRAVSNRVCSETRRRFCFAQYLSHP